MQINPGIFNKKIQIVSCSSSKDKDSFPKYAEVIKLKTWAQVSNISGTELQKANSDFSEIKTRFLIRSPKQILCKDDKIKFCGKVYEIKYINDYGYDKKYTEIITELIEK